MAETGGIPGAAPVHSGPPGAPRGAAPAEPLPFAFTGSAGEYFRIWIVNVALTVLTLGIYAAWAKVRKRRYFWGCTEFDGRGFEYTGEPLAILKGNLILGAFAIGAGLASSVAPLLGLALSLGFLLAFPWLFQRSLRFNAHHTRYRNLRFDFHGSVGESYVINLALVLLIPFTLGLLAPAVQYRHKRYQIANLAFGSTRFQWSGRPGPFYRYAIVAALISVPMVFVASGAAAIFQEASAGPAVAALLLLTYVLIVGLAPVYYAVRVSNYALSHTHLEDVATLHSSLSVTEMVMIEMTNLLAIVLTLGLATPWAAVRRARYRWSHLEAHMTGSLDAVLAAPAGSPGTFGEAVADHFDVDIAF